MNVARSTAAHASVAFLHLPGFAQHPVAEQARLKTRLEELVGGALDALGADERIVLEADQGFAVVVLANPRGALRFAWRAARAADVAMAIGLAHGPVRATQGPPAMVFGDAITSSEAVARAAKAGRISASADFRDALARTSPSIARLLAKSGAAVDTNDRAHVVFDADRVACERRRNRFWGIVGGVAVAILVSGAALRMTGSAPPAVAPIVVSKPGTVTFDVKPDAEIWVNGTLKGRTPPLKSIQLPAGRHTLELRSGSAKPLVSEIALAEGEKLAVQHSFVVPGKQQQQAKGFWRRQTDRVKELLK